MRLTAPAIALCTLCALLWAMWASGCTGLSRDCELNVTCPTGVSSSSGTGGGDGGLACQGVFVVGTCNTCLEMSCCQAIVDCKADAHCLHCLATTTPNDPLCTGAATQKTVNAFVGCESLHCATACVAKDVCNPITNDGCGTDGSTCDASGSPATFQCFPPPNNAQLCGVCDGAKGPYCAPGLHCYAGTCARYCCASTDCGTGVCELDPMVAFGVGLAITGDAPGICLTTLVMDGGVDGGSDGGGSSAACGAPATSMSKGSCVPGHPPM